MVLHEFIENYLRENHPHTNHIEQEKITNAIKAGYYFAKGASQSNSESLDNTDIDFSDDKNNWLLNQLYAKAKQIFEAKDLDWSEKYDMIFSDKISSRVNHLFDYADPDTSYEEDVTAFMNAFGEYVEDKNRLNKYSISGE